MKGFWQKPYCKDYPEKSEKTFGEYLRKARIDARLLIRDLAAKIGVTEDSVINWEIRGRMPRPGAMEALERVFGGYEKTKKINCHAGREHAILNMK